MTVEYVDAGEAVDQGTLNYKTPGGDVAPPVVSNVTYERILNARSEPQNWLTYYGAYNGQRYSPLDQINTENVKRIGPAWVFQAGTTGMIAGASTYSFEAAPVVVDGVMFSPAGTAGSGPSTRKRVWRSGDTSTRSPTTCRCAAGT